MRNKLQEVYVLALAFVLRLLWIAAVPVVPVSDGRWYNLFAQNLALGYGYCFAPGRPTAYWPVGPGFLYSLVYRIFGFHLIATTLLNLTVALLGIWFAMRFAEQCFTRRIALLTGLLLAIWPGQIEFVTTLGSELPFNLCLLILLVVWRSNLALFRRPWLRGTVMGVFAAAASYMRPVAMLLPAVLCLIEILRTCRPRRSLLTFARTAAVMLTLIAPWTLRNFHTFHSFVLISTNAGDNLYEGNHPGAIGDPNPPPKEAGGISGIELDRKIAGMSEIERDRYTSDLARSYIRGYPILFLQRMPAKILFLYARESAGGFWNQTSLVQRYGTTGFKAVRVVSTLFWFVALAAALAGLVLLCRRTSLANGLTHPCFALCTYFTCIYAVLHPEDRYHFACVPFLAILAAISLDVLTTKRSAPVCHH